MNKQSSCRYLRLQYYMQLLLYTITKIRAYIIIHIQTSGLKEGWMTREIWVIWDTFLHGGSSGSHPQISYIIWMWPGYHMFFKKQCWHLLSEWTLVWVWWMHWNIICLKPAYYLELFWSMWCPKISSSRSLCKGLVLYPAKNEEIFGIVPYQKFSCQVKTCVQVV